VDLASVRVGVGITAAVVVVGMPRRSRVIVGESTERLCKGRSKRGDALCVS
jgi:hypothetical protein